MRAVAVKGSKRVASSRIRKQASFGGGCINCPPLFRGGVSAAGGFPAVVFGRGLAASVGLPVPTADRSPSFVCWSLVGLGLCPAVRFPPRLRGRAWAAGWRC